ncbi:hypothetical protein HYQ46_005271 [Verticillium longisporum]|nr:hypothetical protein HYQ46_005271 [Verticillium longisporum]
MLLQSSSRASHHSRISCQPMHPTSRSPASRCLQSQNQKKKKNRAAPKSSGIISLSPASTTSSLDSTLSFALSTQTRPSSTE